MRGFFVENLEDDVSFEGWRDENEWEGGVETGVTGEERVEYGDRVLAGEVDEEEILSYRWKRIEERNKKEEEKIKNHWANVKNLNYPYKSMAREHTVIHAEKNKNKGKKRLKILHWNANGIVGKINEIKNLIHEHKPDS